MLSSPSSGDGRLRGDFDRAGAAVFFAMVFDGRIVKEGGPELVATLEEKGYGWIREEVAGAPA